MSSKTKTITMLSLTSTVRAKSFCPDSEAAYKIVDAKRHGMGLAEFIRRYANESEHTLETLVTAWI